MIWRSGRSCRGYAVAKMIGRWHDLPKLWKKLRKEGYVVRKVEGDEVFDQEYIITNKKGVHIANCAYRNKTKEELEKSKSRYKQEIDFICYNKDI